MIAHLPMYDVPENKAAHDHLWAALSEHYPSLPNRSNAIDIWADWQSPDLVFSQTCGLPFRAKLNGIVQLVGAPDNRLDGCDAGQYRSAILTRKGSGVDLSANDFTLAINEPLSQSGWGAPSAVGITGTRRVLTGAHRASAQAVVDGRADVAAIDALTWHFLQRDWDQADQLTVATWTPPTPTLPYITALGRDPAPLAKAMSQAIQDIGAKDRETLSLYDIVSVTPETYDAIKIPPAP